MSSLAVPQITVLGSLNMDLVSYVSHHPLPGETMTADSFAVSPGGKGANQAVACAKLSRDRPSSSSPAASSSSAAPTANVRMVGAVGADSYGATLRKNLEAYGVDASGVAAREGQNTGVAVIVVDAPSGENRIVLSPEANYSLAPGDFAHAGALGPVRPDLLIMQLEVPLAVVLTALRTAREAGVPVLLNPAPAVPLPDDALRGLAHLVVNETEAAILAGCEVSELDTPEGLERVGRVFVEGKAVRTVIITLGGRGVYYMTAAATGQAVAAAELVPAEKAAVVDTTAAGDTFVGQYALEVVASSGSGGFDCAAAVRKANHAAARTVSRKGAQVSIPWRDEV